MNVVELRNSIRDWTKISFSRSGGKGGQNVNKVNTKVTLRLKLDDLAGLTEREKSMLTEKLKAVNKENEIVIQCDEERSQFENIKRAFGRLESLVKTSARVPKTRKPTKPTKASKEKRLQTKKITSLKKAGRRQQGKEMRDER